MMEVKQKNQQGVFSLNRSETALIAKLFSGYLFNEFIFREQEPLKWLFAEVYQKPLAHYLNAEVDSTYFLRPKDIFRQQTDEGSDSVTDKIIGRSIYSNGHFDIAALIKSTSTVSILLLLEIKYLADIDTGQLLREIELCKKLASSTIIFNNQHTKFDEIYLLTITTWANLHYSRALQVDSNGMITIPGIGVMPSFVKVATFDKLTEIIIKSLELSNYHRQIGTEMLRTIYHMADSKTLTVNGTPKGQPRHLIHTAKQQIEILGIL